MKLLILGGTLYLGRHAVEAARARGHQVTLFNRGRTNPGLFPDVEQIHGDREGDLAALEDRRWDAVLDPSGYLPRAFETVNVQRAIAAGLTYRRLDDTLRSTLEWARSQPRDRGEVRIGKLSIPPALSRERESQVLQAWQARVAAAN